MSNIKTREVVKGTIKTLDKSTIVTQKTKDKLVDIKSKSENAYKSNEVNANEYAINKINNAERTAVVSASPLNKKGKNAFIETKQNIQKGKIKVKNIKSKLAEKRNMKNISKGVKTSGRVVKNSTIKTAKNTKKVAQQSIKNAQRVQKLARETARKTYQGVKVAVKATISAVKAIIAGTKALISAIIAGGWVAVIVIIVICLIGLLCSSIFGIFFSSEDTGTITMSSVVKEINTEMSDKISNIQETNIYDDFKIESDRAEWKEILSIYTAKISKGTNETEVITLDDTKKAELKKIFWDMNNVSFEIKEETNDIEYEVGNELNENLTKKVLYINITSKSLEEMMNLYNFTPMQRKQVNDLLSDDYSMMWSSVIFGTPVGSPDMVQIALSQVGNVGGQPYWSWYGFNSRVEWCAIFVSWVANESGYLDAGIIPKFSGCQNGINWFKAMGQWQESSYTPKSGDIIFFDWEVDGTVSHVGIVEKVENGRVYTVEGNSTNDTCRQKDYSLSSNVIFGYGTPQY
ncbi:MAG: CHAP domain-containing protein [Bacilli bacterium]|nr:CHAP domain-containing protein [Bacilli bacterium]MBP3921275.1 CHAP domain-containing protein [Bacilli bacterium]